MEKTETIESFVDYISFVEAQCKGEDILFRGQQRDWPLLPKVARIKLKEGTNLESTMLAEFTRRGIPYIEFDIENTLDKMSLAQHNGMATRLLDWTRNPLAAMWFAVCMPAGKDKDGNLKDGVVWIYNVSDEDKWMRPTNHAFPKEGVYIYTPNHVTAQITAQQGLFTLHGSEGHLGPFIAMEEHAPYCDRLTKLVIPASSFSELRFQLDRCGINNASMFPGIGGLCRHIEWLYSILDDEDDETI
jgi:hypothetical protein